MPHLSRRRTGALPLVVLLVVAFTLVPLAFVVTTAATTGWPLLSALVFRPRVGQLLVNTVLLVGIGTPVAVGLGVGAAWLVERTTLPGRRILTVALAAPLAVPAFVSSYGWAIAAPWLSGLGGGLFIAVLAYYPLVFLPAIATLRRLDPTLEEVARSLGHGPARVFWRTVLPQLKLTVWGGGLIVALHLLAEYGAFANIRFETFTTAIYAQFQSTFAGPAANALAGVLTLVCVVVLVGEAGTRGTSRYAAVGSGSYREPRRQRLGATAPFALVATVALVVLAVVIPVVSILRWIRPLGAGVDLVTPILQTLLLAGGGAIATVVVGIPVAWLSVRRPGRLSRALEGATYLASSLPGIVVALALVTISIRLVPSLYQSVVTVWAAYVLLFLPRAVVTLRAGFAQAPEIREEVACSLGSSPLAAWLRVTLPVILPSVAAAAALVALGAANELTATLLLAPNGTSTLATAFWAASTAFQYSTAAPFALLLIATSIPAVAIMFVQSSRIRRRP